MVSPDSGPRAVLDAAGRIALATDAAAATAPAVAAAVCVIVDELVGTQTSVISCSVLEHGPNAFAMVMLRDVSKGGYLSGTASADDPASAVVEAVLAASELSEGVLAVVATEWAAKDEVRSVTLIQRAEVTHGQNGGSTREHMRLVQTMPAPGRMAIRTETAEYRVLRFPAMALAVSTDPNAPVLDEVDAWMATAERLGP